MRNFMLALLAVFCLVSVASADTITKRGFRQDLVYEMLDDIKNNINANNAAQNTRCIGTGSTDPVQLASGMKTFDYARYVPNPDTGTAAYGTVSVVLNGVPYSVLGTTGISLATLSSSTQATGSWRIYVIQMRPGAAVETTGASTGNGSVDTGPVYSVVAGTASATRSSATWPALTSSSYVAVGYCIIKANGTFTPGTSTFDTQTAVLTGPIIGPYYTSTLSDVSFSPTDDSGN